jgi:predicted RNA-binding protein associated with RNAse of E/G family
MIDPLLPRGSVAVSRGVFAAKVCCERAVRVIDSDSSSATTARWPGAAARFMTSYIESMRTGSPALRDEMRQAHVRGQWELADWAWQGTGVVEQVVSGRWFSVSRMHGQDGALLCWYVNFERPPLWRPDGWDTHDLALDLVVSPDRSVRWKDEDEYVHSRRLGLISDVEHKAVEAARGQALALADARDGLFAADPAKLWLRDLAWPLPSLPGAPADPTHPADGQHSAMMDR